MDEPFHPTNDSTSPDTLLADNEPSFFLQGCRIALVEIDDADLHRFLVQSGAEICDKDDPALDVIVVDTMIADAALLRKHLSERMIDRLHLGDVHVIGRTQLIEWFGHAEPLVHTLFTRTMLADILGVPVSTIRSWQRRGLIQPVNKVNSLPYFDFQEVAAAKQLATLVELGVQPATIQKNLKQLAKWLPQVGKPLSQLSVLVEGKKILLRQANGLVEPGGQRRLDFDHAPDSVDTGCERTNNEDVHIIPFVSPNLPLTHPDQFVEMAEQQEEAGDLQEAIEVYRSMQLAFGPDADTCLRIGELLFRLGDLQAARERYFMAIELDDSMVESRAALGCVLNELGQIEFAISTLQGALEYHPDYADVHFQLARILQAAGSPVQALRHWERFIALSPEGPWADEARSQVEFLRRRP